jgi:mono/diheme cytochrome c family protein
MTRSLVLTLFIFAASFISGILLAQSDSEFDWQALGEKTFSTNCAGCHQMNGEGVPTVFPPHAGHLPNIIAKEGGRQYLIQVLLNGLQGEIQVKGKTYNQIMPSWNMLKDDEIAAVLNHELTSWGNAEMLPEDFTPILPEEVTAERANDITAAQAYELRQTLGLSADE